MMQRMWILKIYRTINDTSDQEECMIVEAQFLLQFLCSVIPQSDYLYNIANETYTVDNNYQLYKSKISRNNFWRPNIIVSIVGTNENMSYHKKIYVLLLSQIGACISNNENNLYNKTFHFFVNCLFLFSLILLNELNDEKNVFLNNFLNFNNRKAPLMYGEFFFGINTSFIKSFKSINYQSIAMIMKQTCFKGLPDDNDTTQNKTQMTKIKVSITSVDDVKKIFLENSNALITQNDIYSKFLNETKDVIKKFVNPKYMLKIQKKI